jgi:hypothetical protein
MPAVAKRPEKRPVGRPRKDRQTKSTSFRAWAEVLEALADIADIRRRSMSAQMGMAAEDVVLDAEDELRRAGKWNPALDKLKAERRPHA